MKTPLGEYPNREWEKLYRDKFRYDNIFTFTCAPNDTHNCLLRAYVRNGIIVRAIGGSKQKPIRYLQLVESYRDELGRPKHKVSCTLGREEKIINSGLVESLSKKFAAFSKNLMVIDKTKEFLGQDYILGQILVIEGIWKRLRLDETLKRVEKRYGIKYSLNRAVKLMVLNRLIDPKSKLSIDRWKRRLYGDQYEDIGLWHLYRALDLLSDNKDMLEKEIVSKTRTLFKPVVNLVFYDLTTVYFESQNESVLIYCPPRRLDRLKV